VTRVAVVGGGPAGLAAAYRLTTDGVQTAVFEAGPSIGGLARSMDMWGHAVDLGAHMFTLKDPRVSRMWTELVGSDYDSAPRRTRVLFDRWSLPYPFDPLEATRAVGVAEAVRCGTSLAVGRLARRRVGGDLESWVVGRFGRRAFELFFASYVEKLFGAPAREIDGAFAQTLLGFQPQRSLPRRPRSGSASPTVLVRPFRGIGVLVERLGEHIRARGGEVRCDAPVARLRTAGDRVVGVDLQSGETREIDAVVSALPVALTARLVADDRHLGQKPPRFRSVVLVYLLVDAETTFRDQWVFMAPRRFKGSRVTNFGSWSPAGRDGGQTVLSVEFWCDRSDALWSAADDDLRELAVGELGGAGLLQPQAVRDSQVVRLRDAFPVPVVGYSDVLAATAARLSRFANLKVTGGLGAISSAGVHGSLVAGIEAGDAVRRALSLNGAPSSSISAGSGGGA